MTVLIALELNHSIMRVVVAGESIVQVRTVLVIGVLALARKFIIFDPNDYSAGSLLALSALLVVLGVTDWLLGNRRTRQAAR